jgi:hypothetical protein
MQVDKQQQNEVNIPIHGLNPGVYFLEITQDDKVNTLKFIKHIF